jgi:lipoprotein-anchoring transpeptidase ErfK/SrfK
MMKRVFVAAALTFAAFQPAAAQSWVPWHQPSIYDRSGYSAPQRSEEPQNSPSPFAGESRRRGPGPKLLDGGGRPSVSPMSPERVAFAGSYAPGTIVIDSSGRKLYLVQSKSSALRYPISVGREGFSWTGRERISRVADWPDWHPPKEMRERDRSLPEKMTGGVRNPLGAKALYLGNSLYRIHGTNSAQSIGRANSSGCFRMMNGHVVDLSRRVGVGTQVVVLKGLPSRVARSMRDDD